MKLIPFLKDRSGQALVEYALIIALMAVACVGALAYTSSKIQAEFSYVGTQLPAFY